jgi:hypothetical protein
MVSLLRVFSYSTLVGMNAMKASVCLRVEALQVFPQFRLGFRQPASTKSTGEVSQMSREEVEASR